ncbi:hypothetical protein Acr_26g0007230 [Actinidia rufa]|uniref:Uncharacterized protein n=1 Tax=Actinidia rufa TaxID=165716 RepID=A0A7J0H2X9_9ERIC|nr:hypothetical protein Acr_26g0007230 [Actinidia rufa]
MLLGLAGSLSLRCQRLYPDMGLSEETLQATSCPLTSLGIAIGRCPSSKLSSLLSSDNSGVMAVLAQTGLIFGGVCVELQRGRPPNLLHSKSSTEIPALTRPDSVYFVPLHLLTFLT